MTLTCSEDSNTSLSLSVLMLDFLKSGDLGGGGFCVSVCALGGVEGAERISICRCQQK